MNKIEIELKNGLVEKTVSRKNIDSLKEDIMNYDYILFGRKAYDTYEIKEVRNEEKSIRICKNK